MSKNDLKWLKCLFIRKGNAQKTKRDTYNVGVFFNCVCVIVTSCFGRYIRDENKNDVLKPGNKNAYSIIKWNRTSYQYE